MKNKFFLFFIYFFYLATLGFLLEMSTRWLANNSYSIKLLAHSPYHATNYEKIIDYESLNSNTRYSLKPGQLVNNFFVNSHGFLSPELPYKKSGNEYRIVFLGDSFNIGVIPYHYSFINLIEQRLNSGELNRNNIKYQAINLGIVGVGTSIYLKQLEVEGVKYQPELIVAGFYVGNDFTDEESNTEYLNKSKTVVKNRLLEFFYRSRLISLFINLYKISLQSGGNFLTKTTAVSQKYGTPNQEQKPVYDPFAPNLSQDKYLEVAMDKLSILQINSYVYNNLKIVEKNLLAIKELAKKSDAELLVYIIPDEIQVNKKLLHEAAQKKGIDVNSLPNELPQQVISNILKKNKIRHLDLLPHFLKENDPEKLYQPRDSHFNSLGNKKTAEVLTEEIKKVITN